MCEFRLISLDCITCFDHFEININPPVKSYRVILEGYIKLLKGSKEYMVYTKASKNPFLSCLFCLLDFQVPMNDYHRVK